MSRVVDQVAEALRPHFDIEGIRPPEWSAVLAAARDAIGAITPLPIETAPRDGTWILGYAPDSGWCEPAPWVLVRFDGQEWVDESRAECEPTHWMPLPAEPHATP